MSRHYFTKLAGMLAIAALGCVAVSQGQAFQNATEDEGSVQPATPAASRWIGVAIGEVPEIVRAHLDIAADTGVLVVDVVPDGPAAKAGLRKHDILVGVAGNTVRAMTDLANAVRESQAEQLQVEYLRGGQRHEVAVTPAERPSGAVSGQDLGLGRPGAPIDDDQLNTLRSWLEGLQQGGGRQNVPGARLRWHQLGDAQALPQGLSIQIERSGDEPAKIKVQRDGETWDITENDIDALPEDIRDHVRQMLGNQGQLQLRGFGSGLELDGLDLELNSQGFGRQLDEMNRQMEQMFKELQQLRQQRLPEAAPQQEQPEQLQIDPANEA